MRYYPLQAKWWKWGFYVEFFRFIGLGVDIDSGIIISFTLAGGEITLTIGLKE